MTGFAVRPICTLALLVTVVATGAAPRAQAQDQPPMLLRRTALIVHDMEASLSFYRDALGLVVVDDRTRRAPDSATSNEEARQVTRLVLFGSRDNDAGQLELIQMIKPAPPAVPSAGTQPRHLGSFATMYTARDIQKTFDKVKAVPGVQIAEAPHPKTYPSYGKPGQTTDMFCAVYDPDGNFVEINQPMDKSG